VLETSPRDLRDGRSLLKRSASASVLAGDGDADVGAALPCCSMLASASSTARCAACPRSTNSKKKGTVVLSPL